MTRSRILKIKFIVHHSIILSILLTQAAICEIRPSAQSDKNLSNDVNHADSQSPLKQNPPEKVSAAINKPNKTPEDKKSNSDNLTSNTSEMKPAHGGHGTVRNTSEKVDATVVSEGQLASLNAGALKRGFFVLIGLSVLVIAYFLFRSFRVTKTRAQMIRKYGILAHRQDVEMRPLPLDEDDEDDTTVFDVSSMSTHNTQPRP